MRAALSKECLLNALVSVYGELGLQRAGERKPGSRCFQHYFLTIWGCSLDDLMGTSSFVPIKT